MTNELPKLQDFNRGRHTWLSAAGRRLLTPACLLFSPSVGDSLLPARLACE